MRGRSSDQRIRLMEILLQFLNTRNKICLAPLAPHVPARS